MEELQRISADLSPLFADGVGQLWLGDFNALTRDDYSQTEWDEIVDQRVENGREPPCSKVAQVTKYKYRALNTGSSI